MPTDTDCKWWREKYDDEVEEEVEYCDYYDCLCSEVDWKECPQRRWY